MVITVWRVKERRVDLQSGYDGPREASWALQSKHAEWIIHRELCVYLILCQILRVFQANRKGGVWAEEGRAQRS